MAAIGLHRMTVREVQAARSGKHDDGGGLQLKVGDDGRATWVYRFTAPSGRRREMGLGVAIRDNAKMAGASLTAARDAADAARKLLRAGVDPIEDRERQRAAAQAAEAAKKAERARDRWTLARVARDYHARVIERTRTARHAASWIQSLETHVPASLWNSPVDSVAPPALLAALESATPHERARRPGDLSETMRRVRQRLDAACEDGIFHGRCATNPAAAVKRKLSESRPAARVQHLRALDYRELPALMARVRAMSGAAARALEFTVLCASRTGEVLGAEWGEFDLASGVWRIPPARMKGRREHVVFLSPRALAIVEGQRGQDARIVFPSSMPRPDGTPRALSNMSMLAALDRLGARGKTTVHGLARACFSSWANEAAEARPDVVESCLAHMEASAVRRAYLRATFDAERRALLAAWSRFLDGAEVIAFPTKAAS